MANPTRMLAEYEKSLAIRLRRRDGRSQVGTAPVLDGETGNVVTPASGDFKPGTAGLASELAAAEAAFARVQVRVQTAKDAVARNEVEIRQFSQLIQALSVTGVADESADDVESADAEPTADESADVEPTDDVESEYAATLAAGDVEPEPADPKPRGRARRGSAL